MWDSGHHLMAFVFHAVHLVQMDAVQFADLAVSAWTSGCINHQAAIGKAMTIPGETKLLADRLDAALKRHRKASLENPSDIKPAHAALGDILYGETQSIIDGLRRPMSAEPVAWQWRSKAGFWNQVYSPIPDFKSLHERELKIGEIEIRPVYASPPMSVGMIEGHHGGAIDPTNHHNAEVCPYCNPNKLKFAQPMSVDDMARVIELFLARKDFEPTSEATLSLYRKDAIELARTIASGTATK